jgi:hypothetical protein
MTKKEIKIAYEVLIKAINKNERSHYTRELQNLGVYLKILK